MGVERLDRSARIGLGLAAVGRPGYINLGRARDLPGERSVEELRRRCVGLLDEAYRRGVRYMDVARSYGRAEEFLGGWLPDYPDVVVGSKWGYEYTAGWRVDADVHESKDHGVDRYERQLAETHDLLGDRLAALAHAGVTVGFSTSGPAQPEVIRAALDVEVDGEPLFGSVQSTWNVLEQSAGPALAEAHERGRFVIVKEAMANGRLSGSGAGMPAELAEVGASRGASEDAVALAAVLAQPWVDVVLSGAATVDQLVSNLTARKLDLTSVPLDYYVEPAAEYWGIRASLPWH